MAVTPSPGMPSTSKGIIAPPMVALLAVSVATIPSGQPLPNSSGCLDIVLGGHIGKHAGRAAANAGQDADPVPIRAERMALGI